MKSKQTRSRAEPRSTTLDSQTSQEIIETAMASQTTEGSTSSECSNATELCEGLTIGLRPSESSENGDDPVSQWQAWSDKSRSNKRSRTNDLLDDDDEEDLQKAEMHLRIHPWEDMQMPSLSRKRTRHY